ncbi:MAG: fused FliR family export protein/FlhB family type III secretion system protein [Clostridiaceae bacterium]
MFETEYLLITFLISLRLISFFMVLPILFPKGTPNQIKIALSLVLAFIISSYFYDTAIDLTTASSFIMAVISETCAGLFLGIAVSLTIEAIRIAGSLLDLYVGLSMVSLYDPTTSSNSSLIERLFYYIAITVFLIADGHHLLINIIIESYEAVALGNNIVFQDSIWIMLQGFVSYFALAVQLAIPVILIILITDIIMGLVSRSVPQINVMILGLPIKLIAGLAAILLFLPYLLRGIALIFDNIPTNIRDILKAVPVMFIFATEEKTEDATPRKKQEARKKGQVAKSKEMNQALTLLACTLLLAGFSGFVSGSLRDTFIHFISIDFTTGLDFRFLQKNLITVLGRIAIALLPIVIPIMVMGVFANFVQTGFIFSTKALKPEFSKINPISGFKRMFSQKTAIELIKNLAIVAIIAYSGYGYLKDNFTKILTVGDLYLPSLILQIKELFLGIFLKVVLILIVIAIFDFVYQRFSFNKELKMTKQEVKEEYKQDEGDPQLKSKIKQKQREFATRRMMQAIPEATVIVTNPTHFAVALKYTDNTNSAPKVVAKGADYLAMKIKEAAKKNNIPIVENRPLARKLYDEVSIDDEIPPELYKGVAEILAAIYKLKKTR